MVGSSLQGGDVEIYVADDGQTLLEVELADETVWLSLNQMVNLFDRDKSVISRHLRNIFQTGELMKDSVVAKNATTAADGKIYQVDYYNLDAIISVGYRVNSKRGTQFRQWATRTLRDHLVKGYTLNEQRLREQTEKLTEMGRSVDLLTRTLANQELVNDTGKEVLRVIGDYAYALTTLDRFDHGTLTFEGTSGQAAFALDYERGIEIVRSMMTDFDGLFGQEKNQGFKSALGAIYQTFDGKDLYPTVEEKTASLLCFVVKNHALKDPYVRDFLELNLSMSLVPGSLA
jgi:hypothetical protein